VAPCAFRPDRVSGSRKNLSFLPAVAVLSGLLALYAPAVARAADKAPPPEVDETNDPLESVNRGIFEFNQFFNHVFLRPLTIVYVNVIPDFGRARIHDFLGNLNEPVVFTNNVLQGELDRAGITLGRFTVNTVVGIGGTFDVASTTKGLEKQTGDFGQTLYSWGVGSGFYLVLPVLGPSNPRDAIGLGIDGLMSPWPYIAARWGYRDEVGYGIFGMTGLDEYSRNYKALDELERNSIDFYAALRSLSRQRRDSVLRHGAPAPLPGLESLDRDPDDEAAHISELKVPRPGDSR
jgi:phospholipid-binding lipoprotein MlaA